MEVLSSRLLVRPRNLERSLDFYAGTLGLPVYREFGAGRQYGAVFFTGGGYLEVSGELAAGPERGTTAAPADSTTAAPADSTTAAPADSTTAAPADSTTAAPGGAGPDASGIALWLQVRDATAEVGRLAAAGVPVVRAVQREPWGLVEGWIEDPDGMRIGIVEVPADHPLRRRVD
ncbi:MAG: VOC family protein [Actinomycetota bacterium]|nr:VOC family protein [Actinomycetota bacterium]